MSSGTDLQAEAQDFAGRLNDLLRRTVDPDALLAVRVDRPARALVGFGSALKPSTIPVPVGDGAQAHLLVWFDVTRDPSGSYLMVRKSTVGLYLLENTREPLFRYEFERDKTRYTPAHLHVHGQSSALGRLYALAGKTEAAELHELHLPVGGKRFRPSLEDVLECLFHEGLLRPVTGWQAAVDEHRAEFHERQLRAAIRSQPDIAVSKLREMGYDVGEPK